MKNSLVFFFQVRRFLSIAIIFCVGVFMRWVLNSDMVSAPFALLSVFLGVGIIWVTIVFMIDSKRKHNDVNTARKISAQIFKQYMLESGKTLSVAELCLYLCSLQFFSRNNIVNIDAILSEHFKLSGQYMFDFKRNNIESLRYVKENLLHNSAISRDKIITFISDYFERKFNLSDYFNHDKVPYAFTAEEVCLLILRVLGNGNANQQDFYRILGEQYATMLMCGTEPVLLVDVVYKIYVEDKLLQDEKIYELH